MELGHHKSFSQLKTALAFAGAILILAHGIVQGATRDQGSGDGDAITFVVVHPDDLHAAMAKEMLLGYDPTATTNAGRFFANVVFELARAAHKNDADGPPLLIRHEDWFRSFLEVNQLSAGDAPIGPELAFRYQQDVLVDYRSRTIIKSSRNQVYPQFALNVQVSWSKSSGLPAKYSFEDTSSTPRLRVTNQRVIRFRLLDFGDMIVYDKIEGITGRPTSGVLGALFKVIGDGRIVWSRISVASDGTQIACAKATKGFFSVTETITVDPDGVVTKGLPDDSPEMRTLGDRVKKDIEIEYGDWPGSAPWTED